MSSQILFTVTDQGRSKYNAQTRQFEYPNETIINVYGPTKQKLNNSKPVEIYTSLGRIIWTQWKKESTKLSPTSELYKEKHKLTNWKLRVLKEQYLQEENEKIKMEQENQAMIKLKNQEKRTAAKELKKQIKENQPTIIRRSRRIKEQNDPLYQHIRNNLSVGR